MYFVSCVNCSGRFFGFECSDYDAAVSIADECVSSGRAASAEILDSNDECVYGTCA